MNLHSHSISSLQGVLTVPGDKSISHRAAILGGLAQGGRKWIIFYAVKIA